MSVVGKSLASLACVAGFGLAGAALAMPAGDVGLPLPEGAAKIEKVERVCRPDGYCFNKNTGAPMGRVIVRRPPPPVYVDPEPRYQPRPRYVEPEYRRPRRYIERRDYY